MNTKLQNKIMLITYSDCMGHDLKDLLSVLENRLEGAVYGVHLLPFFPSSGDRGFAPVTYRQVDAAFGTWEDVQNLSKRYYLMYDYMINHLSRESDIYKDFLAKKDASEYHDFFLRYKDFWANGEPTDEELDKLYKRQAQPWVVAKFADGSEEKVWATFSDQQIDINCQGSTKAKEYLRQNLEFLSRHGASLIRLDAFAYASKRAGTSCFFIEPEVWDMLGECRSLLAPLGVEILPEIHEHYFIQKKLEEKGYYTYDFQLPMLLLNALYFHKTSYLKNWLKICPRKQFTTLDTHDGIGVVDVRYLMPDDEVLATKKRVFEQNPGITEVYVQSDREVNFQKFDTYQINCTYFSALGEDENKYLLARAVQFFTPGIPQVYYVGLFAGKNDFDLYHQTRAPRDVNRHYYALPEIDEEFDRPVVQRMNRLMRLRNSHPAFQGSFIQLACGETSLHLRWENGPDFADLQADFASARWQLLYSSNGESVLFE